MKIIRFGTWWLNPTGFCVIDSTLQLPAEQKVQLAYQTILYLFPGKMLSRHMC